MKERGGGGGKRMIPVSGGKEGSHVGLPIESESLFYSDYLIFRHSVEEEGNGVGIGTQGGGEKKKVSEIQASGKSLML